MEPFRVICETCHSRLKIRSPEVIGEIHACPKCGSMVQIVPPPGWSAGHAVVAASAPSLLPLEPALSISNTIVGADFHIDDAALAPSITPAAVAAVSESPTASAEAMVVPAAVAGRSPILIWGLSGAALVLIGGLAVAFVLTKSNQPPVSAPVAATTSAKPAAIEPSKDQNAASSESIPAATAPTAVGNQHTNEASEPIASATSAVEADSSPALEPHASTPTEPAQETDDAKVAEPNSVATSAPAVAPETKNDTVASSPPATTAAPVLQFDPLDFDTARLSVHQTNGEAAAGSVPPELPDSDAVVDPAPPAEEAELKEIPPPAANMTVSVRIGPMPADSMKSRDDVARLSLKLDAIQLTDVPLVQFIDTISEMSGAPITLDPIALELAGMSQRAPVSIDSQGAPLEKFLRDVLAKNRLELVEANGRISVGLPDADEPGSVEHEVADLAGKADAAEVARLIEQFVEPARWKSGNGAGTIQVTGTKLHVENTLHVRRQALLFCERLRLARGLSLRSKYPAALLSIASPYQNMSAKLNAPTTFTFLPWAHFSDVIQHWQKAMGVTILVDWSALADVEIGPSTPVACSAVDRTWEVALSGILEPLGLGWWAVSGDTIQITGRDALNTIKRIEFYDVPKSLRDQFASPDDLVTSLSQQWREHAADRLTDVRIQLDEPSGRLILLGTHEAHRWLANLLSKR